MAPFFEGVWRPWATDAVLLSNASAAVNQGPCKSGPLATASAHLIFLLTMLEMRMASSSGDRRASSCLLDPNRAQGPKEPCSVVVIVDNGSVAGARWHEI